MWQPIETAPSYGYGYVIVWDDVNERAHVRYSDGDWWRYMKKETRGFYLTHWMPFPEPPKG